MKSVRFLLCFALALITLAPAALGAPVTFAWNDPNPGTPEVAGWRIYQRTLAQDGPDEPEIVTYQQINTARIDGAVRQYAFDAVPGSTYVIRAYNAGGESPDSEAITIPAPPARPEGFRTLSLVVESSPDLMKWAAHAVIQVAAVPPAQFFRLKF